MGTETNGVGISYALKMQEDRLKRLEERDIDTVAQLAKQTEAISSLKSDVCEKIEILSDSLNDFKGAIRDSYKEVAHELHEQDKRLASIEKDEKANEKLKHHFTKLLFHGLTAGFGALGTWLLHLYFTHGH